MFIRPNNFVRLARHSLVAVALLLMFLNIALHFPGEMTNDGRRQLAEALSGQYTDWHPPIMAFLWSFLAKFAEGPLGMLIFQLMFHWLGFALIADGLYRAGRTRTAWIALLSGAFPVLIFYNGMVMKDVGMASAFVATFGLCFWYRIQGYRPKWPIVALAVLLLAYGTLVRANAIFAFGSLCIYLNFKVERISTTRLAFYSLIFAVIALPASSYINHKLLSAKSSGVIQSLQLFDLNGISYHSGDLSVFPPEMTFARDDVVQCYTPYWWDTLGPRGACRYAWDRLGPVDSSPRQELTKKWLMAIITHPTAYLQHRIKFFNSFLNFAVPAKHFRFAKSAEIDNKVNWAHATEDREIRMDYLKKNFLTWPVVWLAANAITLFLLYFTPNSPSVHASRILLISALFYILSQLFIGVATDVRYVHWSIMATLLAVIIVYRDIKSVLGVSSLQIKASAFFLALVISVGLYARIIDMKAFI